MTMWTEKAPCKPIDGVNSLGRRIASREGKLEGSWVLSNDSGQAGPGE